MAAGESSARNKCLILHGAIQTYPWGKLGIQSKACELHMLSHPEFVPNLTTPYAEMWLGTHPNGPSVLETGETLEDYLNEHPDVLGEAVINTFGTKFPFLLKVLSINKPLSIQAHPDKKGAKHLHSWKPEIYKDDNHKPEMLIALSAFKAMCGFRSKNEILEHITNVPELKSLISEEAIVMFDNRVKEGLKEIFSKLIMAPRELVEQQIATLKKRIEAKALTKSPLDELVYSLIMDHPNDVGVFCPYLLNVVELEEGEALFIPANEPHSYIGGDGVECMATSDNVVRAGLTNKLVDKETLLNMLTYESRSQNQIKISATRELEVSMLFSPPVQDFAVAVYNVPSNITKFNVPRRHSASILLVVEGDAKGNECIQLKKGVALFVPAEVEIKVQQSEGSPRLLMYQGLANIE